MNLTRYFYNFTFWLFILSLNINGSLLTLSSTQWTYDSLTEKIDAKGNVELTLNDSTIKGEHLIFYVKDNIVLSSENITIHRKDETFNSSSLFLNLDKEEIQLKDIDIAIIPPEKNGKIYIKVNELKDTKTKKIGHFARFSTCGAASPHHALYAWRFHYTPNKNIQLFGAIFHNKLSFFPFNIIPIPVPIIELTPIPYYNYQLGERKIVYNFPVIGQKNTDGWDWFAQNKIDYRYKNNQESSILIDWYDATTSTNTIRKGEWGFGIIHHYGNQFNYGSIYAYNYNYSQNGESKQNLAYEIKQTLSNKKTNLSAHYKRINVDQKINSSGSNNTELTNISFTHSPKHLPFNGSYKKNNQYISNFKTQDFSLQKTWFHQSSSIKFNEKNYLSNKRNLISSELNFKKEFQNKFNLNQTIKFNQEEKENDFQAPDQVLKYKSTLTKTFKNNIKMKLNIDYLRDLDQEIVTTDTTTGKNNHLYKLPEIILEKNDSFFKHLKNYSLTTQSSLTFGSYREIRYLEENPDYSLPEISNKIEPNIYFLKEKITFKINKLPLNSNLTLTSGYDQYIFKNKNISIFEGDAQYSLNYNATLTSKIKKFITLKSTFNRAHGHKDNNSPFYSFNKSIREVHKLSESLIINYTNNSKNNAFSLKWENTTGYNWLLNNNNYTNLNTNLTLKYKKRYSFFMSLSKDLNKKHTKENNIYTPLTLKLNATPYKETSFTYTLNLDLNDIVFEDEYNVNFSNINTEFPLGKNIDFKWFIKTYFKYNTNDTEKLIFNNYELETLSIIKKEHERELEVGYNKTKDEYLFKFSFNMFPDDPFIYRKNKEGAKFEGRIRKGAEERFK